MRHPRAKRPPEQSVNQEAAGKDSRKASGYSQMTEGEAVLYTCPSCGAEIVTDSTTAATFCYYCHNPVVLSGRVSGEFLPDLVRALRH